MLVLFCLPLAAAGWGLAGQLGAGSPAPESAVATPAEGVFFGSLSSSSVGPITLLDPFAMLQVAFASKSFDVAWLPGALVVLAVYGLVRGRAFCGWVCPVNLLCEAADWLARKLHLRGHDAHGRSLDGGRVPRRAKIGVAALVLVLSAVTSVPVFEAFSPVSAINKGLLLGSLVGSWTLVAIIVVELFWGRRVWCRAICPLGGFYQVLGRVGLVNVRIDHGACVRCDACERACLADPEILRPALDGDDVIVRAGDCMACGACVDACPAGALRLALGRPRAAGGAARPEAVGVGNAEDSNTESVCDQARKGGQTPASS